jgi:hypothetical protein
MEICGSFCFTIEVHLFARVTMEFFEKNWEWLSGSPWITISFAALFIGIGWGLAALYYERVLKIYEARSSDGGPINLPPAEFVYAQSGRYGPNILANSVKDVQVGEKLSLRAEIPSGSRLHIEINGMERGGQTGMGAWFVTLPFINWTKRSYSDIDGANQIFDAESGLAELEFSFAWTGQVEICVTEGASTIPNWKKIVRVHPSPATTQ